MLFALGLIFIAVAFVYANCFMTSNHYNRTWTDASFGLLALLGFGLIVVSVAVLAYQYLP